MKVTTKLAAGAFALVAGLALFKATTRDPDQLRRAAITCWWTEPGDSATVSWRFGSASAYQPGKHGRQSNGDQAVVRGATKDVPFFRSGAVKVGDRVQVGISWPQGRHDVTCILKAGARTQPFSKTSQTSFAAAIAAY